MSFRTSSIKQDWEEVKDASVSLVKVGASAVEVSSRTALTLSWKNPDGIAMVLCSMHIYLAKGGRENTLARIQPQLFFVSENLKFM